jgi:tetratricopeptide (TPR) repeat protein
MLCNIVSKAIHLTIGEKILLQLLEHRAEEDELVVTQEITQHGIASALGIRQSHVSYDINILEEKELVTSGIKHVRNLKRRRKAYFLSQQGYRQAKELHATACAIQVKVIDGARERTMSLPEAAIEYGYSLFKLLAVYEEGKGDEKPLDIKDDSQGQDLRRESDQAVVELISKLIEADEREEATEWLLNTRHLLRTEHLDAVMLLADKLIIPGLASRENLELQLVKAEASTYAGKLDDAKELLQEVINGSYEDTNIYSEAQYLLGVISYRIGKLEESAKKLIEAHAAADKSGSIILPNINNLLGILAWEKKDFNGALDFYNHALEGFKSFSDLSGMAKAYTNIGILMQESGKLALALDNYDNCLRLAVRINDQRTVASIYANIGDVYREYGKPEEALCYYGKSEDAALSINFQWQVANALYCKALLVEGEEKNSLLARAEDIFSELGAEKDIEKIKQIKTDI